MSDFSRIGEMEDGGLLVLGGHSGLLVLGGHNSMTAFRGD